MASVFHFAEVAAILLVAYGLGWVLGYVAHRMFANMSAPAVAGVPAERIAAVTGAAVADPDALVKAPVIEPVASGSPPAAPESQFAFEPTEPAVELPLPVDPIILPPPAPEPVAAEPAPAESVLAEVALAPVVGAEPDLTSLAPLAIPVIPPPPPMRVDPLQKRPPPRDPEPEPLPPEPEPEVILTATPSMRPGVAWGGTVRGREAEPLVQPVKETPPPEPVDDPFAPSPELPLTIDVGPVGPDSTYGEPVMPEPIADEPEVVAEKLVAVAEEPVEVSALEEAEFVDAEFVDIVTPVEPEPDAEPVFDLSTEPTEDLELEPEPIVEPEPEPIVEPVPEPMVEPAPEPVIVSPEPVDEDAAMRAIEGGWSRKQARALHSPELSDLGTAVAAAQTAVEQVLAQAGIDATTRKAARPTGLPRPRNGAKDNLQRIRGLGALDESTLNNLGVYHFDQIADWTEGQVLWMEDHVFARGRIGHEDWQRQARALAN